MKLLKSIFLVVLVVVALSAARTLASESKSNSLPSCQTKSEWLWWYNHLCDIHDVTLDQYIHACYPNWHYPDPPIQSPC